MSITSTYSFRSNIRRFRPGDTTRILEEYSVDKASQEAVEGSPIIVENGADDVEIHLGGIGTNEGSLVIMTSNRVVTVKVNGTANTAIQFKEMFVLAGGTVSSLHVSNASGENAQVALWAVGKAA